MTPGNNGASTPEDDDPFGYLYADGQANGAQPPSGGYGYPNSVNRVRPVGTRQYGAPQGQGAQTAAYGQAAPPQQAPTASRRVRTGSRTRTTPRRRPSPAAAVPGARSSRRGAAGAADAAARTPRAC